jgi:hypothetical protein
MEYKYGIKQFKSTRDKGYHEALSIYTRTTPADIRTNTNEISDYLDNPDESQSERLMYFFALLFNSKIVGFAELAYLCEMKIVVIDYIALELHYKKNSIFYPFLNLILDYIAADKRDIVYTITEISIRNQGNDTDQESAFFKKMLSTEDFYIIDAPYYQPYLGNNTETNFKCELLIKMPAPTKHMASQTYSKIIQALYCSHYFLWYRRYLDAQEIERYKEHLNEQMRKIDTDISNDEIHLTNYKATDCAYFETGRCAFTEISTAGNVLIPQKSSNKIWLFIPIPLLFAIAFSVGIYYFLQKINISANTVAPFYAATGTVIATIIAIIIAVRYKKP